MTIHYIQAVRGGKFIPLKAVVDEAVTMAPTVEKVFVMDRTGAVHLTSDKDVSLEQVRNTFLEQVRNTFLEVETDV